MGNNIFEKAFYTFVGLSLDQKDNFEKNITDFFDKNQEAFEKGKSMAEEFSNKTRNAVNEFEESMTYNKEKTAERFDFVPYTVFEALKTKVEDLEKRATTVPSEDVETVASEGVEEIKKTN